MLKDFRQFLLRGSLVDLAIAVVIGAAFGAVVAALVKDLITPLIASIGGQPDFGDLAFTINNSRFAYGDFFNAVLSFVIIAAVVFFLVVRPVNALMERMQTAPPVEEETRGCPACLSQIPFAARRCAFCTEEVGAATPPPPAAAAS
jgi:large conductance mechanosensitive channel